MATLNEKIRTIIRNVIVYGIDADTAETQIFDLLEFEIDKAKGDVVNAFKDLPTECIHDCDDTKFCESRLYNHKRCKECFRID